MASFGIGSPLPGEAVEYRPGNPEWNGHAGLVVLSGCSGGGKSTLLEALAARGYDVFPEPGRQIVREEAFLGGEALPWTDAARFAERCLERAFYFFNLARPEKAPVFFDRSLADAVIALERMGAPVPPRFEGILERCRYGRVFLVPPWEALFAQDAERRHGFAEAVAEYEALLEGYAAWGYAPVVVPKGSVAERVAFLEAALDGI
ncbi:MAG: AAA family ATPase [Pseudomonadota bacterium]